MELLLRLVLPFKGPQARLAAMLAGNASLAEEMLQVHPDSEQFITNMRTFLDKLNHAAGDSRTYDSAVSMVGRMVVVCGYEGQTKTGRCLPWYALR